MSTRSLESASEISTHFRCDYCGISIGKVSWLQCEVCKAFDLCGKCANDPDALSSRKVRDHKNSHANVSVNNDCIKPTSVVEAETNRSQARMNLRQQKLESIVNNNKIRNDFEMAIVMDKLKHTGLQSSSSSKEDSLNSLVVKYHLEANERSVNVLCLDGGGVRGYMPIKILGEFITQKYLPEIETLNPENLKHKELFYKAQLQFTKNFDYFAGTSTGGIIAFCLAIGYNILDIQGLYADSPTYFIRNGSIPFLSLVTSAKYNPSAIHGKIDEIINSLPFPGDKKKSAANATLLDLRNLLNPDKIIDEKDAEEYSPKYGNLLEFVDKKNSAATSRSVHGQSDFSETQREKVLLITAYNTTYNMITIFNTSYSEHWGYLIADVIKSTMAAPTYFPPLNAFKGDYKDGRFQKGKTVETFIDGGVFANDPELAALWAIRMQWKKPMKYHILSVGTGVYNSTLSPDTWGGYWGWLAKGAILIDTLMGAPGSFTEIVGGNLAKFSNMRRMKLNYKLKESMNLDDPNFVGLFNKEWEHLKNEDDYKAFFYFYGKYIENSN